MNTDHKKPYMWLGDKLGVRTIANAVVAAILIALLAVVAGLGINRSTGSKRAGGEPQIWPTGPTIEHIQSLNQLVSTKVSVSDVLSAEGGGVKGAWLIKGDALIGIDFNDADIQVVDRQKRLAAHAVGARRSRTLNDVGRAENDVDSVERR